MWHTHTHTHTPSSVDHMYWSTRLQDVVIIPVDCSIITLSFWLYVDDSIKTILFWGDNSCGYSATVAQIYASTSWGWFDSQLWDWHHQLDEYRVLTPALNMSSLNISRWTGWTYCTPHPDFGLKDFEKKCPFMAIPALQRLANMPDLLLNHCSTTVTCLLELHP